MNSGSVPKIMAMNLAPDLTDPPWINAQFAWTGNIDLAVVNRRSASKARHEAADCYRE